MNHINIAVRGFSLEEGTARVAAYVRIASVVSFGLALAVGAAIGRTLHARASALLDDLADGA